MTPARRRAARGGEVDRREHRGDAAGGTEEPAPVHSRGAGGVVGARQRGRRDVEVVTGRRAGYVLAVGGRQDAEREPDVAVGIIVAASPRHAANDTCARCRADRGSCKPDRVRRDPRATTKPRSK
jgi:hypothetical protein